MLNHSEHQLITSSTQTTQPSFYASTTTQTLSKPTTMTNSIQTSQPTFSKQTQTPAPVSPSLISVYTTSTLTEQLNRYERSVSTQSTHVQTSEMLTIQTHPKHENESYDAYAYLCTVLHNSNNVTISHMLFPLAQFTLCVAHNTLQLHTTGKRTSTPPSFFNSTYFMTVLK